MISQILVHMFLIPVGLIRHSCGWLWAIRELMDLQRPPVFCFFSKEEALCSLFALPSWANTVSFASHLSTDGLSWRRAPITHVEVRWPNTIRRGCCGSSPPGTTPPSPSVHHLGGNVVIMSAKEREISIGLRVWLHASTASRCWAVWTVSQPSTFPVLSTNGFIHREAAERTGEPFRCLGAALLPLVTVKKTLIPITFFCVWEQ